MAVSKVVYNGLTLMDITDSTVTPESVIDGAVAYGADGSRIVGTAATEDLIAHADIPDYVKEDALDVARRVNAVRTEDSIVFIAMADSHYYGTQGESGVDTYVDANGTQGNISNLHGAMAAKILAYALNVDFFAHLGDLTWGHKTTTSELLHSQVKTFRNYISEAYKGIPTFICIGNHDPGIYYHNAQIAAGNTGIYTESGSWLYENFTALSESDDTVMGGEEYGGYCYRDFSDKKLRVFMLNTSETMVYQQEDNACLGSQLQWFANALLNLNSKDDAAEWSWLLLCHYPADYGGNMPMSELMKAYVEGNSISITDEDGNAETFGFSGKNGAKLIAQFHGHVHNFLVSKLHSYATGSAVEYDAWRVCIPNGQYNRENYYSTVGNYKDIDFSQEESYLKTPGTAQDTSFVVNVINPGEKVIHSFCYGAGYDRAVGYGETVYYGISRNFTNVTMDSDATSVQEGGSFSATLTADEHCAISSVVITMGGVDVTSSVYADGGITIPEVTGDIVITVVAEIAWACTNQISISTDADGNVYNGYGYKAGYRLSSSGADSEYSGYWVTGFIPVALGDVIRMQGMYLTTSSNNRVAFYDSSKNILNVTNAMAINNNANALAVGYDDEGNIVQFTLNTLSNLGITSSMAYMRVSNNSGITADSILTVNEEIKYVDE